MIPLRYFIVYLFLFLFLCSTSDFSFGYDLNDVNTIEKKVIESRLAIKNWHVIFVDQKEPVIVRPFIENVVETGFPIQREFWYDNGQTREDFTFLKKGCSIDDKDNTFKRIIIWSNTHRFSYYQGLDTSEEQWSVSVRSRDSALQHEGSKIPVTDIRLLGMAPFATFFVGYEITDVIGNSNRTEISMVDDLLDGIQCKVISFRDKRLIPVKVWIVPEQGYSIIRIDKDSPERNFHTRMLVNLTKHTPSNIWFPNECICTETNNDAEITHKMTTQVKVVSFNTPISDDIFSPKTMDIPTGTIVTKTKRN